MPGGGSAAALVGGLGAALLCMSAYYTADRMQDKRSRRKVLNAAAFSARSMSELVGLMKKDEKAYSALSAALKADGARAALRKKAADVPLRVCGVLHGISSKIAGLTPYCKKALLSDLAESALLVEAAFTSARLNVEVNLPGVKDAAYSAKAKKDLVRMGRDIKDARKAICRLAYLQAKS